MYRFFNMAENKFIPALIEVTTNANGTRTENEVGFMECETRAEADFWLWGGYERMIQQGILNGCTPEAAKGFVEDTIANIEIVKVTNV